MREKAKKIEHLDQAEIESMVSQFFGSRNQSPDSETFDEDSSVFVDINKLIGEVDGRVVHVYLIELEDKNGNRIKKMAVSEGPDLEFERSMKTIKLVQTSPELKKVYDAFSHVLAEWSAQDNAEDETNAVPAPENP